MNSVEICYALNRECLAALSLRRRRLTPYGEQIVVPVSRLGLMGDISQEGQCP